MVASYAEFLAERRAEHLHPVNRWSAVVANYLVPVAAVATVVGKPRVGAAIFAVANVALGVGHAVEGNLRQEILAFATHPIWAARADVAVANATVRDAFRGQRR